MKTKQIIQILEKLEIDPYDLSSAKASFEKSQQDSKGLLWNKIKSRAYYAGKIAKLLKWEDNRLLYVKPEWKKHDIEPLKNVSCNGDNFPWVETPEGGRPDEDTYLNTDPSSPEYKEAVASCYWKKGHHPRSYKARKAWYRRNAGAFDAYNRGEFIDPHYTVRSFEYEDSKVKAKFIQSGVVWEVQIEKKIFWKFGLKIKKGYEISNAIREDGVQLWYPIEGFELKAPVTNSTLPYWRKD